MTRFSLIKNLLEKININLLSSLVFCLQEGIFAGAIFVAIRQLSLVSDHLRVCKLEALPT